MGNMQKYIKAMGFGVLCALAPAVQAQGSISLKSTVEIEKQVADVSGKLVYKRMPADKVVPGSALIYTNSFTNVSKQPVSNVSLNNPIPANLKFISAFGENTTIKYSLDGKNFAMPDQLLIKTANGLTRKAKMDEYKSIQWTYNGALPVGQTAEVGFKAILK